MDATELMARLNGLFCQIKTTDGIKVVDTDLNEITDVAFDYANDKLILK